MQVEITKFDLHGVRIIRAMTVLIITGWSFLHYTHRTFTEDYSHRPQMQLFLMTVIIQKLNHSGANDVQNYNPIVN